MNGDAPGRGMLPRRADQMAREYIYGRMPDAERTRAGNSARPLGPRGVPDTGRIVKLFVGQGHGTIRAASGREIYFHRADMQDGTSINDFRVGDLVAFERLDDRVSGARALGVVRRAKSRR